MGDLTSVAQNWMHYFDTQGRDNAHYNIILDHQEAIQLRDYLKMNENEVLSCFVRFEAFFLQKFLANSCQNYSN